MAVRGEEKVTDKDLGMQRRQQGRGKNTDHRTEPVACGLLEAKRGNFLKRKGESMVSTPRRAQEQ